MKRLGNIFETMCEWTALQRAFVRTQRAKRSHPKMQVFAANLEENLSAISRELLSGEYRFGKYHQFTITDPKERVISAAPIRDRVVHHAMILVAGKKIEDALIANSFACRTGKGQWRAVAKAKDYATKYPWCLKLDIRHYFDTIDHEILKHQLRRLFKDARFLGLCDRLIDTYETEQGKGIPIGNLTSQFFANYYLNKFDRWLENGGRALSSADCADGVKSGVRVVRYMDDVLVFGERDVLREIFRAAPVFLREKLRLELKAQGGLHRTTRGVDFLGTRIYPHRVLLSKASRKRAMKKIGFYEAAFKSGCQSESWLQTRLMAVFAFVRHTKSKLNLDQGQRAKLSRRARRLLEQQQQRGLCRMLPLRVSLQQLQQQQQPESSQQLLGLPLACLSHSSMQPRRHQNRPWSGSRGNAGQTHVLRAGLVGDRSNATRGDILTYEGVKPRRGVVTRMDSPRARFAERKLRNDVSNVVERIGVTMLETSSPSLFASWRLRGLACDISLTQRRKGAKTQRNQGDEASGFVNEKVLSLNEAGGFVGQVVDFSREGAKPRRGVATRMGSPRAGFAERRGVLEGRAPARPIAGDTDARERVPPASPCVEMAMQDASPPLCFAREIFPRVGNSRSQLGASLQNSRHLRDRIPRLSEAKESRSDALAGVRETKAI